MFTVILSIIIGLAVATLEILMVRTYQKNKVILAAIGLHWLAISLIMPFIDFGFPVWLTGSIVGIALTLPFIVLETRTSRNAVIHTAVFAPTWGMVLAYSTHYISV